MPKTKKETFEDFLKIKTALNHFPTVQELQAFPGGGALYINIIRYWGRYHTFREKMFPPPRLKKTPLHFIVMVIFPDKGIREYVDWFLAKKGHSTFVAAGSKEALQKLSAYKRVLAIIDKNIEQEAAGFINELHRRHGQVIILETPFSSESLEVQVIQAIQRGGFNHG